MKALKIVGGLLVVAAILLIYVANFSAVESRLECQGKITASESEKAATVFLKIEKYRWWVGLWSDSTGSAWVELPNQTVRYFGQVTEAGEMLQFWDSSSSFGGNFSPLSGAVGVALGEVGVFDGTCKSIRQ